ncbi:MAG: hypothetical protein NVS9B12_09810 [Vulcanimicrobiaceae bacterium]
MKVRIVALAALLLVVVFAAAGPASAKTRTIVHGGTYWGGDVLVERDQVIDGDVTVFFGDAIVEGRVNGDVNDVGGTIDTRPGSVITGSIHNLGGDYVSAVAPWAGNGWSSSMMAQNARMLTRLAYSVIVLLIFLIFPVRVRVALDRLEHHPGLSTAVGMLALVAVVPVMILLALSIIGIPLIPVEIAVVLAGVLIGQAALGLLVGRRLFELVSPRATPSPLAALVLGLVMISLAEIIPGAGVFVTMLVVLVGLGAAALAMLRDAGLTPPPAPRRAPISGPPMNAA